MACFTLLRTKQTAVELQNRSLPAIRKSFSYNSYTKYDSHYWSQRIVPCKNLYACYASGNQCYLWKSEISWISQRDKGWRAARETYTKKSELNNRARGRDTFSSLTLPMLQLANKCNISLRCLIRPFHCRLMKQSESPLMYFIHFLLFFTSDSLYFQSVTSFQFTQFCLQPFVVLVSCYKSGKWKQVNTNHWLVDFFFHRYCWFVTHSSTWRSLARYKNAR